MTAISTPQTSYFDPQGLQTLKQQAGSSPENLAAVAKQFESLFMKMILDSARDANSAFGDNSYLSSRDTEFYQQMLDDQLSVELTKNNGLGIAAMLVKQLSPYVNAQKNTINADSKDASAFNHKNMPPELPRLGTQKSNLISVSSSLSSTASFSSAEQFVQKILPHAQQAAQQLGIQPEYLVAQAALESGWGKNMIPGSHNLFGIKADASWHGPSVSAQTTEVHDGRAFSVTAKFRAYASEAESFNDYVKFIKTQPRYQQALAANNTPDYYRQLQAAGYATDPNYAEKITAIAQQDRVQSAARLVSQEY